MDPHGAPTILLVEDDPEIARAVARALSDCQVWHADNGAAARRAVRQYRPDLIVLDLTLPDVDGLVLCLALRSEAPDVPIVACAEAGTRERILGLQVGADDVVAKPLDLVELEARVKAVLRRRARESAQDERAAPSRPNIYRVGTLVIDLPRWRATVDAQPLELTPTEFQLLAFLVRHAGEVVSRERVARCVWRDPGMSRSRSIDTYVRRVRRKLVGPGAPSLLNVYGLGYLLTPPTR